VKLFSKKQDIVKPQITDNSFTEITNKQSGDIQTGNANDLASATDDIAVSIQKKSDSQSAITATADKIINILKRKGFNTSRIIKSSEISTLSRKEHFGIKSGSPNKLKHSIVRLIFYILLILFIILIFAILASALGASGFLATLLKPVGTGGGVLIAALLLLILILLLL
jgi:membrane-bound ClpP family serine protease